MKKLNSKNNFLGLDDKNSSYNDSQVIITPVTLNKNSVNKSILSILKESHRLSTYDEEQKREISLEKGICTLETKKITSSEKSLKQLEQEIGNHIDKGKYPVILGSENIISLPVYKANASKYKDLSLLSLSAYSNLSYINRNNLIAKISELNKDIMEVGIRSISKEELTLKNERRIKIFYSREIKLGMYGDNWQELIAKDLQQNVFIIFDLSVFDPSVIKTVPAEPGGLFWDEIMNLIKIVGIDKNIVGLCITGFNHSKSESNDSYLIAKLIYKILNYMFS